MVFRYNAAGIYRTSGGSIPTFGYFTQAEIHKWSVSTYSWRLERYGALRPKIHSSMLAQSGRLKYSVAFIRPPKKKNRPELAWMTKLMHLMKPQRYYTADMPFEQYHGHVDDRGETFHVRLLLLLSCVDSYQRRSDVLSESWGQSLKGLGTTLK